MKKFKSFLKKRSLSPLKIYDLLHEVISGREMLLSRSECTFWGDNMATRQYVGFAENHKLHKAIQLSYEGGPECVVKSIQNTNILWRHHITCWAISQIRNVDGAIVECGVWYGWLTKALLHYASMSNDVRPCHLFDTWGGAGSIAKYPDDIYDYVCERFNIFPNAILHRGAVPDSLTRELITSIGPIAMLSIDMNGGIAERQALELLYPSLASGAIIYFDDYGWDFPALRTLVDEFLTDKPEELLHFPNGSSIMIKK